MYVNRKEGKQLAKQKENTERINVFFSSETLYTLKQLAIKKGLTVSGLIRMIVLEYLQK